MKESLILIGIFLLYSIFFKIVGGIAIEYKANLIIFLTFLTVFLFCIDLTKIKIDFDCKKIKLSFIENLVFLFLSLIYSMMMVDFFEYVLFSHFIDLLFYFPIFIVLNFFMTILGYKNYQDFFLYQKDLINFRKMLVKVFFIPFIYGSLYVCLNNYLIIDRFYVGKIDYYFYLFGLSVDVLIALFGYVFASNWLSNRIQSVDSTWSGWLICLICYPPFLFIYQILLSQVDSYTWKDWADGQWYYYVWMFFIVISWVLYWLSHAHFGFKFSNLTWRGLVDTGLYKYFKHPAYLFKNIYWWIFTVPFFGVFGWDFVKNILVLIIINLIYFLRAKTEERHLREFKEYRDYEEKIKNNGFFSKLKKMVKL